LLDNVYNTKQQQASKSPASGNGKPPDN